MTSFENHHFLRFQGSCHVIKCLNLDKDSDSTRADTSQEEDDEIQLTAEFLDTMDKHAARAKGIDKHVARAKGMDITMLHVLKVWINILHVLKV